MKKAVWHIGIAFIMPDRRTIVCMEQKNVRPDIFFLFYYPFFFVAYRFLSCKNYMSVFFTFGMNKYSLYGSLLLWRSVLSQKCERACSGAEQGIVL